MPPSQLLDLIYRLRTIAYVLIALVFVFNDAAFSYPGAGLLVGIILLAYPCLLQRLLCRYIQTARGVRLSLLVDAPIAGALTALLGFSSAGSTILLTLLVTGLLIVGGIRQLLPALVVFAFGGLLAAYLLPVSATLSLAFTQLLYVVLLVYMVLLGSLVYFETRRLNLQHRQDQSVQSRLEAIRRQVTPYVAPQLFFLDRQSDHTVPQLRRKRLTVFFSDLQGFTHLMDRGDETVVAAFLNEYFETVYRVSEVYGGTLDKFLGDGVMVFFGDPGSDGPVADAYACVSMALDMRNRVVRLVERWQHETGIAYPGVRMGIHTGYCLVGSLGCQQRRDYTALGGTVNIASRLEGEAAPDEIIMSEDTRRLIRPWVFTRDLGDRRLRGVSQPIRVHAVQGVAHRGNGRYLASSIQLLK